MENNIINKVTSNNEEKLDYMKKFLDINGKYKIDFIKLNNSKLLGLFTMDNKLLITGNYNFFGIYNKSPSDKSITVSTVASSRLGQSYSNSLYMYQRTLPLT